MDTKLGLMTIGIYKITNTISNKFYIGSSINISNRFSSHRTSLRKNSHCNHYLQNAWNKNGEEAFKFEILIKCDAENCILYEQIALDYFKPEYNICKTAGNTLNFKHSEKTKELLRYRCTQRKPISEETRLRFSRASRGRKHTEETKEKIRQAASKQECTEETRKKLREKNLGKTVNKEIKDRISRTLKEKWKTEQHFNKGKRRTPEMIKRMIENHPRCAGEQHSRSKLTWKDVSEIRRLRREENLTLMELSKIFKVSYSNISLIINNKGWVWEPSWED